MKYLRPVKKEVVSAERFLAISEQSKNIEKTRFIAPIIGKNGFGKFEITYKYPELRNG